MGMKRHLFSIMAMAAMLGGGYSPQPTRSYSPRLKPTTPEQDNEKFEAALKRKNKERKENFPKFKEWEVYGFRIIAFNQKNAVRDMNTLMRENYIPIPKES